MFVLLCGHINCMQHIWTHKSDKSDLLLFLLFSLLHLLLLSCFQREKKNISLMRRDKDYTDTVIFTIRCMCFFPAGETNRTKVPTKWRNSKARGNDKNKVKGVWEWNKIFSAEWNGEAFTSVSSSTSNSDVLSATCINETESLWAFFLQLTGRTNVHLITFIGHLECVSKVTRLTVKLQRTEKTKL